MNHSPAIAPAMTDAVNALRLARAILVSDLHELALGAMIRGIGTGPDTAELTVMDRAWLAELTRAIRAVESVIGRDLGHHPAWLAQWIDWQPT